MRIDILCKPDCGERCDLTLSNVRRVLDDMNIQAEVHVYKDNRKMIDNRVYVAPALVVDDDVRVSGRIPEMDEIAGFVRERPRFRRRQIEAA